jgi:hypothetical protein
MSTTRWRGIARLFSTVSAAARLPLEPGPPHRFKNHGAFSAAKPVPTFVENALGALPMSRTPIATLAAVASLIALAACGGPKSSDSSNVTLRDMEVVDGTANDAMADLDNATQEGTMLENGAAAASAASVVANQSAAMPNPAANATEPASADKGVKKTKPGAAE